MINSASVTLMLLWGLLMIGSYHELNTIRKSTFTPVRYDPYIDMAGKESENIFGINSTSSTSLPVLENHYYVEESPNFSESLHAGHSPEQSKTLKEQYHGLLGRSTGNDPLWKIEPLDHKLSYDEIVKAHTNYCFNSRVSQSIPLDRDFEDFRTEKCQRMRYKYDELPQASIIIIFHNEEYSVLLRSVHSILNRTPPSILEEIILVDDYSDHKNFTWLHEPLEMYVESLPKTRILRLSERHGLMRARSAGMNAAKSSILVVLDSHIETGYGWLEPLIDYLNKNPQSVVIPTIGGIDTETFAVQPGHHTILGFTLAMGQEYLFRSQSSNEPVPSPIMAGGLFAVRKAWFDKIGGYDRELQLYGGEEFELAFKAWMCGGSVVVHPCSHVAHVFRSSKYWKHQVYHVPGEIIRRNKLRVAKVWMDDYAKIINCTLNGANIDIGSLEEPLKIKKSLGCKSFQWYLDTIYPDFYQPNMEGSFIGQVQHTPSNKCFDTYSDIRANSDVKIYPCHNGGLTQAYFIDGKLALVRPMEKLKEFCVGVQPSSVADISSTNLHDVQLQYLQNCSSVATKLTYDRVRDIFYVIAPDSQRKYCLNADLKTSQVHLTKCTPETEKSFKGIFVE